MRIKKGVKKKMSIPIWIAIIWILVLLGIMSIITSVKNWFKKIKKVGFSDWYESWMYK